MLRGQALRHGVSIPLFKGGDVSKWMVSYCLYCWLLLPLCHAQTWQRASHNRFTVETAATADADYLAEVFSILQTAERDLRLEYNLTLPDSVRIRVHPTLQSYTAATGVPWYVAAIANRDAATLETQRIRVLLERNSLEKTLRHELFHLAQPADWSRWLAEGSAMLFAGEVPSVTPLDAISEVALNERLAAPTSAEALAQAAATARVWARRHWRDNPPTSTP